MKKKIANIPILIGGCGEKKFGKQYHQGYRVYDSRAITMAHAAHPVGGLGGETYLYLIDERNKQTAICRTN